MAKSFALVIIAFLSVVMISSCKEETIKTETGKFGISTITPTITFIGREINIFGNEFGSPGDSSFVLFDTTLSVSSVDCIKWNNSLIKLKILRNLYYCNIMIIKGIDTSNAIYLKINDLPPLDLAGIQAGTFEMGSVAGFENEKPRHKVTITRGSFI